jgi:superfamily II DNA or RNA helicase
MNLASPPPTEIELPRLEMPPIRHALGEIRCVLDAGGRRDVVSVEEVQVSARRKEPLYRLSDGQAVVVTARTGVTRPAVADGVLHARDGEAPRWLSHRRVEELRSQIAANGLVSTADDILRSWKGGFQFSTEERNARGDIVTSGLRPPQVGGLYAIGAHWSLYRQPATLVMPTGTGKTETMLAALPAYVPGRVLVVVPSQILREQTAQKFLRFGLLRTLGALPEETQNPIVGIIRRRPRTSADLDIFRSCNVVITTMSALTGESSSRLMPAIAQLIDVLIVDEAHHIAAATWSAFRSHFDTKRVLQFTATPFRQDGKLVDGKVIFTYHLRQAQEDGYFKKIAFESVYEIDQDASDQAIAEQAIARLRHDLEAGFQHLAMARCASIERARDLHALYRRLAPDLAPVIVHSDSTDPTAALAKLRTGESRIVVCVNMLGEGYDLPQLKVAALHDPHKSLAVLLQFTGRFTRTADATIGDATVVANIADPSVSTALERLYSEDADWNLLLSEYSSAAVRQHAELIEFLQASTRLGEEGEEPEQVSNALLRPKFSAVAFSAPSFSPMSFHEGLPKDVSVRQVWLHNDSHTLYLVARSEPAVPWTRSRELKDRSWALFVLHHDPARQLLYLHSSDTSSTHDALAQAVGAERILSGDPVFRCLGGITRLRFNNIGVRKHGRRNLRYALYTGADVAEALSISERAGSVKSNLFGFGWENGEPASIGCSYKGRVWSRENGTIPELIAWCSTVGAKLQDESIDTTRILDNVLIPEEVDAFPSQVVLSVDWPLELLQQSEERVVLRWGEGKEAPLSMFGIGPEVTEGDGGSFRFRVASEEVSAVFRLEVGGDVGFRVRHESGSALSIQVGRLENTVEGYLSEYPPLVRFVDLSELDGNLLVRPHDPGDLVLPTERFEAWDWDDIDVSKESIWRDGVLRKDSIQWRTARHFVEGEFDVVFDDDGPGEAADLVCLKEEDDHIRLVLAHCKFASGEAGAARVQDVSEVCNQAVRSSKWKWKFRDLCMHVIGREKRLANEARPTRFLAGEARDVNRFVRVSRFKEIRPEIIIVQPGLSLSAPTADQRAILAAAHSFLKETIGSDLDVICSA